MQEIILTQGKVTQVDDRDYTYLNQWKWYAAKHRGKYYAARGERRGGKLKTIYMHHVILNTPPGFKSDHEDHNGLNNQRFNLRPCTNAQNQYNRNKTNGRLLYKGVQQHIGSKKYITKNGELKTYHSKPMFVAHIKINGKLKDIGRFKTAREAATRYNEVAKVHFGEFAKLNIL